MYIILVTKHGRLAKIDTNEFPAIGRGSVGVKAITLKRGSVALDTTDDYVVAAFLDPSGEVSPRERKLMEGMTWGK